ncbi:MAG: type 4a pilus biogenesis protein PilO [Planctomycetota bacterium]
MNRLSEKQLLILTIAVTALLTGGLGFLVWNDLQTIDEEQEKVSQIRSMIQTAETEIARIPGREYQVIADREIADKEVSFLPGETEIENFWEILESFAEEAGVRISEIASSKTVAKKGRGASKSTIQSVPQIMSLRATTDELLRFINLIENFDRVINVIEYRISSGEAPDLDGKSRHGIQLALTTFTYSKKVANTIVSIPKYDQKKDHPEVKKRLGRIKIHERETYTLRTSMGRRDPFQNVRRKVEKVDAGTEEDQAAQEAILDNLIEELRTLEEGLEIEDHLRKIGDLFRLAQQVKENRAQFRLLAQRIDEVQRGKLVTIRELQERFRDEVLLPFNAIKEKMLRGPETEPHLTTSQVKEWYDRIGKHFDERDWKKVQEEVRDFMDISKAGKWVVDDARPLADKIADFMRRAKVIQEFEKRKVVISTILYSPTSVSVAIINSKQYTEGDALDADGRVLVVEIGENYVIFETQGVEIKRVQTSR